MNGNEFKAWFDAYAREIDEDGPSIDQWTAIKAVTDLLVGDSSALTRLLIDTERDDRIVREERDRNVASMRKAP